MTKTYFRGYRGKDWDDTQVLIESEDGVKRALPHKIHHSPTGMEWGYYGSGPADLARSILHEVFGLVGLYPPLYMRFKADFVGKFPAKRDGYLTNVNVMEWELSKEEVLNWANNEAKEALYNAKMWAKDELLRTSKNE